MNNRENGDPVSYIRTTLVDRDSGGRFLDKQWTAVDVPRANGQPCVFDAPQETGAPVRQSFQGGRIYVVYTAFSGSGASLKGQILFSYSADCGVTWSRPRDLTSVSSPDANGDGIVNTADLNLVKASVGKRCGDAGFVAAADVNGDCLVDLLDLTLVSRNLGKAVSTIRRIPQGATIAIHPLTGAVYVAWREFKAGNLPDAIQFASSTDFGATFSAAEDRGHLQPVRPGHDGNIVPHERVPDDCGGREPYLSRVVGARIRDHAKRSRHRRRAHRHVDVDDRRGMDGAACGRRIRSASGIR